MKKDWVVHNQFLSSVYLNGYLIHNAYLDHTVEILASYMVKALLWVLYCMYAKCRMTHTTEISIKHMAKLSSLLISINVPSQVLYYSYSRS